MSGKYYKEKEKWVQGKKNTLGAGNQSFTSILRRNYTSSIMYTYSSIVCVYVHSYYIMYVEGELMEEPLPCVFPRGYIQEGPEKN